MVKQEIKMPLPKLDELFTAEERCNAKLEKAVAKEFFVLYYEKNLLELKCCTINFVLHSVNSRYRLLKDLPF